VDRVEYDVDLRQDFVVPESQNPIALRVQPGRSRRIRSRALFEAVLRSIHLDNQSGSVTNKVDNVGADRSLFPEMRVSEWNTFEVPPQSFFSFGHSLAKNTRQECVLLS